MNKLMKKADKLWSDIVIMRANNRSEVSGELSRKVGGAAIIQAHHICRKPNYSLRYDLENGIALTSGEHNFGIHGNLEEVYREKIKAVRGEDVYQQLMNNDRDLGKKSLQQYYDELKKIHDSLVEDTRKLK